uniref:hypothetical protein n=1 Tax=Cephaloticoccus sp. TaxID=1985742 RepID=UPI00404AAF11
MSFISGEGRWGQRPLPENQFIAAIIRVISAGMNRDLFGSVPLRLRGQAEKE